jgi:histidinol-phosphate/aromatic aminotransferase/cobyric acid decarboxylase-like protein
MSTPNHLTKTVYSIMLPQTKHSLNTFRCAEGLEKMFEETWTKKQDGMHQGLFSAYEDWARHALDIQACGLPFKYPTNGSSEAIREEIVYLNSLGKRLVVYEGEYEGYEMIAKAVGMPYLKMPRPLKLQDVEQLENLTKDDVFFISQPSAIDGNDWPLYTDFMRCTAQMGIEVYLDLTYLPFTKMSYHVDGKPPKVAGLFWSLSKAFGVYYHRIGGCYLKRENPLLYGNMWFKNLFSIQWGEQLLRNQTAQEIANTLREAQMAILQEAEALLGVRVCPSTVPLLCLVNRSSLTAEQLVFFERTKEGESIRVCLSPLMEKWLNEKS